MSKAISGKRVELILPLSVTLTGLFLLTSSASLFSDAYLSEDRIFYGADSYSIDYEREIIDAKGHAFFRKEQKKVSADRILIYYSKGRKRALFFDRVVVHNEGEGYTVTGDYGEALFEIDDFTVTGDVVYRDESKTIRSRRVRSPESDEVLFSGEVRYEDRLYRISSSALRIAGETAEFEDVGRAEDLVRGDSLQCRSIRYHTGTGETIFEGDVLYAQGVKKEDGNPLYFVTENLRYVKESDTFTLSGKAFLFNGDYSLRASIIRYDRQRDLVRALGDAVLESGTKTVYSDSIELDVTAKKVMFFTKARGHFLLE